MSVVTTVALEVASSGVATSSRRTYNLPVTVGRGSGCDIQLAADNRAISRVHLEIVAERGRIAVYNRASNPEATQFQGRSLGPNERVEVVPGDRLTIFDTVLTLLEPAKIGVMIARRSDLKPIASHQLLPGGALLAHELEGALTLLPIADLSTFDAAPFADRLTLLFYYDDSEPTFAVLANPASEPVLLDRAIVEQQAVYVRALDTIEVGQHRYEVMTVGEATIVCEDPACQVLNANDRCETCRICGERLFGATRMLRVRQI